MEIEIGNPVGVFENSKVKSMTNVSTYIKIQYWVSDVTSYKMKKIIRLLLHYLNTKVIYYIYACKHFSLFNIYIIVACSKNIIIISH